VKKIVFFDGDGTLWYPKRTRFGEKPWWIYRDPEVRRDPRAHLMLTPKAKSTLKALKGEGMVVVVLSTRPSLTVTDHEMSPKDYRKRLNDFAAYFGIDRYIDEYRACDPGKGDSNLKEIDILSVLKRRGIPKSRALMVGDSYAHDYLSSRRAGIDCVLIDSFRHTKGDLRYKRLRRKIQDLGGVFRYLK